MRYQNKIGWFAETKTIRWLEIYLNRRILAVKNYFSLYFTGNYEQLLTDIRKLEQFTTLETRN